MIVIKRKNIKHLYLRVRDNKVIVSAPLFLPKKYIDEFIASKMDFINSKIKLENEVEFLGKKYKLEVIVSKKEKVVLKRGICFVYAKEGKKDEVLQKWYRDKSKKVLEKLTFKYAKMIDNFPARITIRKMYTRWGSCNYKKRYINYSLELIKKHPLAIEYVVLHELSHLIYPNHSKEFYKFIEKYMPDWKKRKKLLSL